MIHRQGQGQCVSRVEGLRHFSDKKLAAEIVASKPCMNCHSLGEGQGHSDRKTKCSRVPSSPTQQLEKQRLRKGGNVDWNAGLSDFRATALSRQGGYDYLRRAQGSSTLCNFLPIFYPL